MTDDDTTLFVLKPCWWLVFHYWVIPQTIYFEMTMVFLHCDDNYWYYGIIPFDDTGIIINDWWHWPVFVILLMMTDGREDIIDDMTGHSWYSLLLLMILTCVYWRSGIYCWWYQWHLMILTATLLIFYSIDLMTPTMTIIIDDPFPVFPPHSTKLMTTFDIITNYLSREMMMCEMILMMTMMMTKPGNYQSIVSQTTVITPIPTMIADWPA